MCVLPRSARARALNGLSQMLSARARLVQRQPRVTQYLADVDLCLGLSVLPLRARAPQKLRYGT